MLNLIMHLHGLPTSLDKWNNVESTAWWKLMKLTIIIVLFYLCFLLGALFPICSLLYFPTNQVHCIFWAFATSRIRRNTFVKSEGDSPSNWHRQSYHCELYYVVWPICYFLFQCNCNFWGSKSYKNKGTFMSHKYMTEYNIFLTKWNVFSYKKKKIV